MFFLNVNIIKTRTLHVEYIIRYILAIALCSAYIQYQAHHAFAITTTPSLSPSPTASPSATPTVTPIITMTPIPGDTNLYLQVYLHGIGVGGDNANPSGGGNIFPKHPQRNITITIHDKNENVIFSQEGVVTYEQGRGLFSGYFSLGRLFPTGNYIIKVYSVGYLRRQVGTFVHLTRGVTNTLPSVALVAGDVTIDNKLSILDYNQIINCYIPSLIARKCSAVSKSRSDFNDDSYVNGIDYNIFLREIWVQPGK
jgi:hypothetical protein